MEVTMCASKQVETLASRIANDIVELVERVDGPVTLARVDREVGDFATSQRPSWERLFAGDHFIWANMTQAGDTALANVLYGRRVSIQSVSVLPYILDDCVFVDDRWWPIVLLPAKAANLESPTLLIRATAAYQSQCMARAAASGKQYRLLTPGRVRCTADQFAVA
jgi:hypothetical protein